MTQLAFESTRTEGPAPQEGASVFSEAPGWAQKPVSSVDSQAASSRAAMSGGGRRTEEEAMAAHSAAVAARVVPYLRSLGLRDEATIDRVMSESLQRAMRRPDAPRRADWALETLLDLRARVRDWVEGLVEATAFQEKPSVARGQLLWRLQPVLAAHPAVFLQDVSWIRDHHPEALGGLKTYALRRILPEGRDLAMRAQELHQPLRAPDRLMGVRLWRTLLDGVAFLRSGLMNR